MRGADQSLFFWINHWPEAFGPPFYFLSQATKLLIGQIILAAAFIALVWNPKTRPAAIIALLAFPVANGICDLFKSFLPMERPSVDYLQAIVRVPRLTSNGTASAHSANMACVAAVFVWSKNRNLAVAWIAVAFLTGLSRIYNGVHYPSQVLLGWTIGALVGTSAWKLYQYTQRNKTNGPTLKGEAEA
ncbi:MAG: phosphatase PAP2 family protein [Armatimonadetes bacterium]|nr:phosphatase PAP2 family protein [Armatimonadota bacterium]